MSWFIIDRSLIYSGILLAVLYFCLLHISIKILERLLFCQVLRKDAGSENFSNSRIGPYIFIKKSLNLPHNFYRTSIQTGLRPNPKTVFTSGSKKDLYIDSLIALRLTLKRSQNLGRYSDKSKGNSCIGQFLSNTFFTRIS